MLNQDVEDVGPTLYKCYINVLCLLGIFQMIRKELTKAFMMISKLKIVLARHGLYKNISAFQELKQHWKNITSKHHVPMSSECWASVADAGPTFGKHWFIMFNFPYLSETEEDMKCSIMKCRAGGSWIWLVISDLNNPSDTIVAAKLINRTKRITLLGNVYFCSRDYDCLS